MWVVRPGVKSKYYDDVINDSRIYLSWEGLNWNFEQYNTKQKMRDLIVEVRNTSNRTTISNLSCQIEYFYNQMKIGDYILIPSPQSHTFTLAKIVSDYEFNVKEAPFNHSRKILIICQEIPRTAFPQQIRYSLCAYRTIFHVKQHEEVKKIIQEKYNIEFKGDNSDDK